MIHVIVSIGIIRAVSELCVWGTSCGFEAVGDGVMGTEFDL